MIRKRLCFRLTVLSCHQGAVQRIAVQTIFVEFRDLLKVVSPSLCLAEKKLWKERVGLSIQIPGDKADLSCFSPTPAEHPKNMARTERSSRKQMALRHAITTRLSVAQESIVAPVVIVLSSTSTIEDSVLQLFNW